MNSSDAGVVSFPFQLSGFSWCLLATLQCPTDGLVDFGVFTVRNPDASKIASNFKQEKPPYKKIIKIKREIFRSGNIFSPPLLTVTSIPL